jgi:hypothetical protein
MYEKEAVKVLDQVGKDNVCLLQEVLS